MDGRAGTAADVAEREPISEDMVTMVFAKRLFDISVCVKEYYGSHDVGEH